MEEREEYIPVLMEVKEFYSAPSTLYITAALSRIDKKRLGVMATAESGETEATHVTGTKSNINIAKLLKNVNAEDGKFLKYVPDQFLSWSQKRAKRAALAAQAWEYSGYGKGSEPGNQDKLYTQAADTQDKKDGKGGGKGFEEYGDGLERKTKTRGPWRSSLNASAKSISGPLPKNTEFL